MVAADLVGPAAQVQQSAGQQLEVQSQSFHDRLLSIVALHKDGYLTAAQFESHRWDCEFICISPWLTWQCG